MAQFIYRTFVYYMEDPNERSSLQEITTLLESGWEILATIPYGMSTTKCLFILRKLRV